MQRYLDDDATRASTFAVQHARARRHESLSLNEENLVTSLAQDGIHAWGRLYDQLSGTLVCDVQVGNEIQPMGLAQAAGMLQNPDDRQRESAWRATNAAWDSQVEACSAAINAIAGWRLEMVKKRSAQVPVHYLDGPAHMNRIRRSTLDTVMSVAQDANPIARRAAALMARIYGKEALGPWDVRAPAPQLDDSNAEPIAYRDALALVRDAYGGVDRRWASSCR